MNKPESEEPIEPKTAQPINFKDNNSVILNDSYKIDKNKDDIDNSNQREKRQFEVIKELQKFKDLLKKDNRIRKDFHGNRDFYNLIKGIAIELGRLGDTNDEEKVPIIIKYIERNIGGTEYDIDINYDLVLDDIRESINTIRSILEDYDFCDENKNKNKISSVFLFKKVYILILKDDPNSKLKI